MRLKHLQGPVVTLEFSIAAAATAATADSVGRRVPFRSKVVGAYWIPTSAMSGAASNNRQIDVVNKASGSGTAVPATMAYTANINATAYDDNSLTVASTSAVNLAEGDIVSVQTLVNGTGLPCPTGTVVVALQAR